LRVFQPHFSSFIVAGELARDYNHYTRRKERGSALRETTLKDILAREAKWTEGVAIGSADIRP
jgi:hypothetical protein